MRCRRHGLARVAVRGSDFDYYGAMLLTTFYPGSMTARQFEKAAKAAKASPLKRERARRVLVDGESALDVAASDGVTVGRVYDAIRKIRLSNSGFGRTW